MKKVGRAVRHNLPIIEVVSTLGLMYLTASLF